MVRKVSVSKLKSESRKLERQTKKALNDYNREVRKYNREVRKAVNEYNAAVRKHNATVRRNKQIIERELHKINSATIVCTDYYTSSRTMHQQYEIIGRAYNEGTPVTAVQDRLLDLIEQEEANSLITENYITGDVIPEEDQENVEIGNKLLVISEDLFNRWRGAVFALNPNNPDATRHFCTSTRELFTKFLELMAPDEAVFAYNPQCDKTDRGNATRREKIKYMMRNTEMDDSVISFVEADIVNILELNQLLSGGTHGSAGKFSFEKLLQVKKRVELGISFLCEISQLA